MYKSYRYNKDNTNRVRPIISSWIDSLHANYVLTIQFPIHQRSSDYWCSRNHLERVMKDFEYFLLGNSWYKQHVPFVAFVERGVSGNYHYHLFLYNNDISLDRMVVAMNKLFDKTGYNRSILYLDPVFTSNTSNYCTKEIMVDINNHFNTDNIILSDILFKIPDKYSRN